MPVYSKIKNTIASLKSKTINSDRIEVLAPLIEFIQSKVASHEEIRLNFICTHNSRRSHLSQIWAQTMAHYFEIDRVFCYSGGTESTALFPKVAETLRNSGFEIETLAATKNPIYSIKYGANQAPIIGFSKTLTSDFNPNSEFAAVMTCGQADRGCPIINGAEKRVAIPYDDPKVFDNTPQQTAKYEERSLQIATEMYYIFSQIKS